MDDPVVPTPPPTDGGARAFQPTADPAFLWLGPQHGAALTLLRAAVIGDGGLLVLAGPPGTGKTVLTQALGADVDGAPIVVGWLAYPSFEGLDFMRAVALAFGLPGRFGAPEEFRRMFERFLGDTRAGGRRPLLIVDEAQALPGSVLESMRALPIGPDPAGDRPSFSVLLAGHAELLDRLRAARLEPDVSCRLHPLTREHTEAYIAHRLRVAGITNNRFSPEAIRQIWTLSGGVPRVINALCYHALGMQRQESRALVTSPTVLAAAREFELDLPGAPPEAAPAETVTQAPASAWPPPRRGRRAAVAAAAALVAALGLTVVALQARPAPDAGTAPASRGVIDATAGPSAGPGAATTDTEPEARTGELLPEPALLPRAAVEPPAPVTPLAAAVPAAAIVPAASTPYSAGAVKPPGLPATSPGPDGAVAQGPGRSVLAVPGAAASTRGPARVAPASAPVAGSARVGAVAPAIAAAPRPGNAGTEPDPARVIDWLLEKKEAR